METGGLPEYNHPSLLLMRYGSKERGTYEPPSWTKIPGFDISLQKLEVGTTLRYGLEPNKEIKRGFYMSDDYRSFYLSDDYEAEVVLAQRKHKKKQMLESKNDLWFCFNAIHLGKTKEHTGHWIIHVPKGTIHDGSSVSLARLWTGSGISRTLAPAGLLHDFITRVHTSMDGYIYVQPSLWAEPRKVRATIGDLAIIWGAAVESLTERPRWHVKLMENFLKIVHPIHLLATPEQHWRRIK